MMFDFLKDLNCILQNEDSDYHEILASWENKKYNISFMPAICWYGGTYNLFDQKAGIDGQNMIWIIPTGQCDFFWLHTLQKKLVDFYENDVIDISGNSHFPGIETEVFEESILLHSNELQNDPEHTILGANVVLIRLSLSSGRDTIILVLLDHQDVCWNNIIERYRIALTWFVDSGRGTEGYYSHVNLYKMMKQTIHSDILPVYYFKGLYNKGEVPDGFKFLYAMISYPEQNGYDKWQSFSAVYDTGWKTVHGV